MKPPEVIYTKFKDVYYIDCYENGSFILKSNPYFYSYNIAENDFKAMVNGQLTPRGLGACDPQIYLDWKKKQ